MQLNSLHRHSDIFTDMLALLTPLITRGVIDNTEHGLISLRLWFVDGQEPLHVRMTGNCLRDIAGCRVEFSNPTHTTATEVPELVQTLRRMPHHFNAGDITFARRVPDNDNRGALSNILYIEFFIDTEKRVLLEFSGIPFDISLPQWEQSWEEDNVQQLLNMEALRAHIRANVELYKGPSVSMLQDDMPPCRWDYVLNRAEAYMAIYPSIHDKYGPEPGGYLSAAFVMDRTDFLHRMAAEDEAHMPPDAEVMNRDWEVTDFLPKEEAEAVYRAMHHALFREASQMTALVQSLVINGAEKVRISKEAIAYVNTYSGVVAHLLATLLLAEDANAAGLMAQRLQVIIRRMRILDTMARALPPVCSAPLCRAGAALLNNTEHLLSTLHP